MLFLFIYELHEKYLISQFLYKNCATVIEHTEVSGSSECYYLSIDTIYQQGKTLSQAYTA